MRYNVSECKIESMVFHNMRLVALVVLSFVIFRLYFPVKHRPYMRACYVKMWLPKTIKKKWVNYAISCLKHQGIIICTLFYLQCSVCSIDGPISYERIAILATSDFMQECMRMWESFNCCKWDTNFWLTISWLSTFYTTQYCVIWTLSPPCF